MQTVTTARGDKVFFPDSKEICDRIATVDKTGWVSFGWIGHGDMYIVDNEEWSSFVAFVNEIAVAIGEIK